jgi:hypothetical protein
LLSSTLRGSSGGLLILEEGQEIHTKKGF